jgi:hypothetical protein
MPTHEPIDTNVNNPDRPQKIYKGEMPAAEKMTALRMWNSSAGGPGVNNDGFDTAGLKQNFHVGDVWNDMVNKRLYECRDNSQGAALWTLYASSVGLLGTKETDETDLINGSFAWFNPVSDKFEYAPRWDDLRFPATAQRQGQGTKPDFDFTNIGWLMPENVATESVYMLAQFDHGYKLGSDIEPHVHFIQTVAAVPTFKLDYRWYDKGDTVPAFATIETVTETAVTFAVGIHQRIDFPKISGAAISKMSSMMDLKLYRDDTSVSGDVLTKEFDIHFRSDSDGSKTKDTK